MTTEQIPFNQMMDIKENEEGEQLRETLRQDRELNTRWRERLAPPKRENRDTGNGNKYLEISNAEILGMRSLNRVNEKVYKQMKQFLMNNHLTLTGLAGYYLVLTYEMVGDNYMINYETIPFTEEIYQDILKSVNRCSLFNEIFRTGKGKLINLKIMSNN